MKYIPLTQDNYFQCLELGMAPMDWIKTQARKGSGVLNNNNRVITFDGDLLDFRRESNALESGFTKADNPTQLLI